MHLVSELLDAEAKVGDCVLDPFCGTGTTALACAERGITSDTTDINPFLLWLTRAKTQSYSVDELATFRHLSEDVAQAIRACEEDPPWIPPIHQIEKWWEEPTIKALGRAKNSIASAESSVGGKAIDLLKIAFCRTLIAGANISFGHQSMSFRKEQIQPALAGLYTAEALVVESWHQSVSAIFTSGQSPVLVEPSVLLCDARDLQDNVPRSV